MFHRDCFDMTQSKKLRMNVEPQFLPLHTAFTTQSFTGGSCGFSHRIPAATGRDGTRWRQRRDTYLANGPYWSLLTAKKQKEARMQSVRALGQGHSFTPQPPVGCSHPTPSHRSLSPPSLPPLGLTAPALPPQPDPRLSHPGYLPLR